VVIQENKDPFNWIAALQLTLSLAMTSVGTPPHVFLNVVIARNGARHFVAIQENKDPFNWIAALQLTLSLAMTSVGTPPCFLLFVKVYWYTEWL
jgi:hypothetical protein